jgi:hypothetical protein
MSTPATGVQEYPGRILVYPKVKVGRDRACAVRQLAGALPHGEQAQPLPLLSEAGQRVPGVECVAGACRAPIPGFEVSDGRHRSTAPEHPGGDREPEEPGAGVLRLALARAANFTSGVASQSSAPKRRLRAAVPCIRRDCALIGPDQPRYGCRSPNESADPMALPNNLRMLAANSSHPSVRRLRGQQSRNDPRHFWLEAFLVFGMGKRHQLASHRSPTAPAEADGPPPTGCRLAEHFPANAGEVLPAPGSGVAATAPRTPGEAGGAHARHGPRPSAPIARSRDGLGLRAHARSRKSRAPQHRCARLPTHFRVSLSRGRVGRLARIEHCAAAAAWGLPRAGVLPSRVTRAGGTCVRVQAGPGWWHPNAGFGRTSAVPAGRVWSASIAPTKRDSGRTCSWPAPPGSGRATPSPAPIHAFRPAQPWKPRGGRTRVSSTSSGPTARPACAAMPRQVAMRLLCQAPD